MGNDWTDCLIIDAFSAKRKAGMQPKTTLQCLFFLLPVAVGAQELLATEVRAARAVEEFSAATGPETSAPAPAPAHPTPPVAPVSAPEDAAQPTATATEKPESEEDKPQATAPKAKAAAVGESSELAPVSALNAATLLPIGVPSYDVRMPEFDEDRLISRMRVRELTRIDDQQLDLRDMDLERYLPDGSLDYVVHVERGFYALSTGRLISSAPTRLRGKAMDLHGQGCVYSKDNEVIKILGKVTSYIYVDGGKLTQSDASSKPDKKPAAPANGTP